MKKLIFAVVLCVLMLGMMTSLSVASNPGTTPNEVKLASCIDQGLTCVLNGTPCCAPSTCKGKFPNTTCQ